MRELLTYPLELTQVREELKHVIAHLGELGYQSCEVRFGFAWGNSYYPNEWTPETLKLDDVLAKVDEVERAGLGKLGEDDLFLKLPGVGLEFRFCNDTDIHLSFDESSDVVEAYYSRWKALGYSPAEWSKRPDGKSERIRFN